MNAEDRELLLEFRNTGSDAAFTELARRHVNSAYSAALRMTQDRGLAEEATQAAFVLLARKAAAVPSGAPVGAWLHRAVTFICRDIQRRESARIRRENRYIMENQNETAGSDSHLWEEIAPIVDDGLSRMNEEDRRILILRFMEQKGHAQLASELGCNEPTVRKRVSRAVDRLREFLARRGVAVPLGALDAILLERAVTEAPSDLLPRIAGAGVVGFPACGILAEAASRAFLWAKIKAGLLWGGIASLVTATTITASMAVFGGNKELGVGDAAILPSGNSLQLAKVTFDSSFSFTLPESSLPILQAAKRFFLKIHGKHGSPTGMTISGVGNNGQKDLRLFTIERIGPRSQAAPIAYCQILDEQGREAGLFDPRGTMVGPDGQSGNVWQLNIIPRSSRQLTAVFYASNDRLEAVPVARFRFPNPAHEIISQLEFKPLPRVASNGPVNATLLDVRSGPPESTNHFEGWIWVPSAPDTSPGSSNRGNAMEWKELILEIESSSMNSTEYAGYIPRGVRIRDSAGATWEYFRKRHEFLNRRWRTHIAGGLPLETSAIQCEVQWIRTNRFAPTEIWQLDPMTIPENRGRRILHWDQEIGETDLEAWGITGRGGEFVDEMQWYDHFWGDHAEEVVVVAFKIHDGKSGTLFTLLDAVDDRGEVVPLLNESSREGTNLGFQFRPSSTARSLRLRVACQPGHWTDFGNVPVTHSGPPQRP